MCDSFLKPQDRPLPFCHSRPTWIAAWSPYCRSCAIPHLVLAARPWMPFCRNGDMSKVTQRGHWRSRIQVQVSMDPKVLAFNHCNDVYVGSGRRIVNILKIFLFLQQCFNNRNVFSLKYMNLPPEQCTSVSLLHPQIPYTKNCSWYT